MADFTLEMPRIATVVYPKDIGAILVYGDIFPGARVLEAGTGSGALTSALLRAVGPTGSVASYDVRSDMLERARSNVESLFSDTSNLSLNLGDVGEGFSEEGLDRIVLDLPEPWHVAPHAEERLLPGGIFSELSADHTTGAPVDAGAARTAHVRPDRDLRGYAARLDGGAAQRAPGPSHGGAHRLHHHGSQVLAAPSAGRRRGIAGVNSLRHTGAGFQAGQGSCR